MDFRVLGPVSAFEGSTEIVLGGPKQRLVLALLLAAQGASVSTDALIDGVWGEDIPATAKKTLQGYVHHLRTKIGPVVQTDKSGYSLPLGDHQVDARRFAAAVDQARSSAPDDPAAAVDQLTAALASWHGNPYADLDDAIALRPEITRLNELRLVAIGDRIEGDLALGRHETLVGELESLTVEYPLQERFRGAQMLALYRSGRQGEALRAYARARDHLIDELGIEPSDQLAALEQRMLARDPSLNINAAAATTSVRAIRGYELRDPLATDGRKTMYRGFQRSIGREVTIGVSPADIETDPGFGTRYEAEVARLASLDHPHLVAVQDWWRESGQLFEVTPWIEGDCLDDWQASTRPGRPAALRLIDQVASALTAAHRVDVVHGALDADAIVVDGVGDAHLRRFELGHERGTPISDCRALAALSHQLLVGAVPATTAPGRFLQSTSDVALGDVFDAAFDGASAMAPDELALALRHALGEDFVGVAAEPPSLAPGTRCPYKGLEPFDRDDHLDFHGRDDLVHRIEASLSTTRLVAVVGPSGSGKSSVVKAGLVPALARTADAPAIAQMYPGAYPFEALEAALRAALPVAVPVADRLLADHRGLARVVDDALATSSSELVLVIDQFEELFARVASEEVRSLFLDSIVTAVTSPESRIRVIVTMRADFFDRPLQYATFGALVDDGLVSVAMPDQAGLTAAIEQPAAAVGLTLEPGLVSEILHDVNDEPGGLPLLQYALTELFERRTSQMLTVDVYRSTGGVLGALGARAEAIYGDLDQPARRAIQQALLRLVSVDDATESVRRRVTHRDLHALEVDGRALDDALQRFGAHRLLTFDSDPVSRAPTVTVAHEALLREWERLRLWVDDRRDELILRRRLQSAVQEWQDAGEDPTYLYRGRRLAQLDAWAADTDMALTADERAFLHASREHDEAEARKAARRRGQVLVALGAALVIAVAFGAYAMLQRNEAADQAFEAETARLGNQAGFVAESNRQMALLMAVETYRRDPGLDGLSALQRVLVDAGGYLGNLGAGTRYVDARWATADALVAATAAGLEVIDASSGRIRPLPVDVAAIGQNTSPILAASASGLAVATSADGRVWLIDAETAEARPLPAATGAVAAAVSPDGTRVAVGHEDGDVEVFDVASDDSVARVAAHPRRPWVDVELDPTIRAPDDGEGEIGGVARLAFDATGARLLSAGGVFLRAWTADLTPLGPEIVHSAGPDDFNLVATEPTWVWFDAARVVIADPSSVITRDASTGDQLSHQRFESPIREAAPGAPDTLHALTTDGRVLRVDIEASPDVLAVIGREVFDTQETAASAMTVNATGSALAVATDDGVVVASLDGSRLIARAVPIGASTAPSLRRDGQVLAAGFANDGLHDLAAVPPTRIAFDAGVELAQTSGSPSTFRFANTSSGDVLLWTSTFMEMRNAYDFETGTYLGDFWGSYVPAWSDRGDRAARVTRDGRTQIVETQSGAVLYEAATTLRSADFDQRGSSVVLVTADGAATLVDLEGGTETTLPAMPGGTISAGYTARADELVSIGADGDVWLVGVATARMLRALDPADSAVTGPHGPPVFTTDGVWMFAATDGLARVWHLPSGRAVGRPFPTDPTGTPSAVADGPLLRVVSPVGGNALVWDLDPERWVDLACQAAGRNMSEPEWVSFGPRDAARRATCPDL